MHSMSEYEGPTHHQEGIGYPNSAEMLVKQENTLYNCLLSSLGMQCYTDKNRRHLLASVSSCVASLKQGIKMFSMEVIGVGALEFKCLIYTES